MIKIKLLKKGIYGEEYICKDEFISINDNNIVLKYIRLMKKIKHIDNEKLIKNIYKILFEISVENVDIGNLKVFINNYYKRVKDYKKHMISLSYNRDSNKCIIDFYVDILKNENIDSIRYILHILYNEKILKDKYILEWYHNLDKKSKYMNSVILKDFMEWLENQSSESECDSDDVDSD